MSAPLPAPISDPTPCAVTLDFQNTPTHSFSYLCTACTPGWQVATDGCIRPPYRSRRVQFSLSKESILLGTVFAGFWFGKAIPSPPSQPSVHWPAYPSDDPSAPQVSVATTPGNLHPAETETLPPNESLMFDFTKSTGPLYYQLAVAVDGGAPIWDDPRIYDDGSQ